MSPSGSKSIWAFLPYDPHISMRVFEGIEAGLIRRHPDVFCRPFFQNGRKVESFFQDRYQGLIGLLPGKKIIERGRIWGRPTINISSRTKVVPFPSVRNDELAMGRLAAELLIRSGATRLFFLGDPDFEAWFLEQRRRAVVQVAEASSVEVALLDVRGPYAQGRVRQRHLKGRLLAEQLKAGKPPVYILISEPRFSPWLREALDLLGWALGEDAVVLQIGSDIHDLYRGVEGISYIPHDWRGVGEAAALALGDWLESGNEPPPEQMIPPLKPVFRSSTRLGNSADLVPRMESIVLHSDDYGWTVEGLADELGVHPRTLNHHFRAARGESVKEWLSRRRHERACHFLDTTSLPVVEVAARCGFTNPRSFSHAFRRREGVTPTKWRLRQMS